MSSLKTITCKNKDCKYAKNNSCNFWHKKHEGVVVEILEGHVKILQDQHIRTYKLSSKNTQMLPGDMVDYDTIGNVIYERISEQTNSDNNSNIDIVLKVIKLEQHVKALEHKIDSMLNSRKRHADLISDISQDLHRQNRNIKELYAYAEQNYKAIDGLSIDYKSNKKRRIQSFNSVEPIIKRLKELQNCLF